MNNIEDFLFITNFYVTEFIIYMNIIDYYITQKKDMKNWVQTRSVPKIIDEFTYKPYESDNPFRLDFSNQINQISNDMVKQSVNVAQNVGAEVFSAYTNPYYLSHKMINMPSNVVEIYNKYSSHSLSSKG